MAAPSAADFVSARSYISANPNPTPLTTVEEQNMNNGTKKKVWKAKSIAAETPLLGTHHPTLTQIDPGWNSGPGGAQR